MGKDYRIELIGTSAKTQDVRYAEGARSLAVEIELAGFGKADWVALESDLKSWAEPAGLAITQEEGQRIREQIRHWCSHNGIRLDFVAGVELRDFFEAEERNGWVMTRRPDGAISADPPHLSLLKRVRRLWRCLSPSGGNM